MMPNYCNDSPLCYNWAMTEIEAMLQTGMVLDLDELYKTGELILVPQELPASNPITPETPGFEHLTQKEIAEILETEGS